MIELAIMIEGQNGLNWLRWKRIAREVEELGFAGLYRSDHYTNANPPDKDSLELWVSLTWLASSGGRLILGVGAGWQEREHNNFGWDLLDISERFNRFQEGLEVITRLLKNENPVDFEGKYYQLNDAILLPRPQRDEGPPILIGGNGRRKTLPLTARYANEWNALFLSPEEFGERNTLLDDLLTSEGRQPDEVKRSMMTGCVYGKTNSEVESKVNKRTKGQRSVDELQQRGMVVGTAAEILDQINKLEKAGVQRLMLQWLDLDDIDSLRALAEAILP
jgi:alkanesulfonate monooxygenase SsuD/methylene tetrahydromethanopterin reductase-like flavin-dependent oxidoreductase (luciferase family)